MSVTGTQILEMPENGGIPRSDALPLGMTLTILMLGGRQQPAAKFYAKTACSFGNRQFLLAA